MNCLKYFKKDDRIISCDECNAIFTEENFSLRPTFQIEANEPNLPEKVKAIIYKYISNLYSNEYINYLKSKTDMGFKNALEIGSKYGTLIKNLNKNGIDALGIESDQRYIQLGVTNKIKWEYFDENYQSDTKYDLICLTQVIYYLPDSYAILKCVKNMLKPNGLIFIATVNPNSSLLKKELKSHMHGSVMILSKKNYQSLRSKLGLEVIDYSTYRSDYSYELLTKNRTITRIKFLLIKRKLISSNSDGNICFILLKPIKS